jgi:predicted Zn-dependent protease
VLVRGGRAAEAAAILEQGIVADPAHPVCWTNLVVALIADGRPGEAQAAVERARRAGVMLNAELEAAAAAGGR